MVLVLAVSLPIFAVRKLDVASAHVNTASNSQWDPFSPALVEKYRAQGRPVVIDFTATGHTARSVIDSFRMRDIEPGVEVGPHALLVCVTEMTSKLDIDRLTENSHVINMKNCISLRPKLSAES